MNRRTLLRAGALTAAGEYGSVGGAGGLSIETQ